MSDVTYESVLRFDDVLDTSHQWDILAWRNSPEVRKNMIDDTEISLETHQQYLEVLRTSQDRRVLILSDRGEPLMVVNLEIDRAHGRFYGGWYSVDKATLGPEYPVYASFVMHDSMFGLYPSFAFESQVMASNKRVLAYNRKLGYRLDGPRIMELKSGIQAEVYDSYCNKRMWEVGSSKMRPIFDRVIAKSKEAQLSIAW